MTKRRMPFMNYVSMLNVLETSSAPLRWTDAKCKSYLWSDESTLQVMIGNLGPSRPKCKQRVIRIVIRAKFESQHL